mgnify:CR=1 FL=1
MIGIWPATTKYRQVATHQGQQQAHIGSCEAARGILMVAFCVLLFEAAAFPLTGVAMSVSAAPAHADCGFRHLCLCSCRVMRFDAFSFPTKGSGGVCVDAPASLDLGLDLVAMINWTSSC